MALKNIKFIDVVNGEILRVEHDGMLFERAEDGYEVQKGDLVMVIESDLDFTEGGFYKVEFVDFAGDPHVYDDAGDENDFWCVEHVVFKCTARKPSKNKKDGLKKGTYVRITGVDATDREMGVHGFEIGEIVRVIDVLEHRKVRIKAEHLDGRDYWYVHGDDFEVLDVVDEEEVRDEIAYAKIGRKNKEIKAGDIVQVIADSLDHKVGTIGVAVNDADADSVLRVRANGDTFHEKVRLIAPVESVVNKSELD